MTRTFLTAACLAALLLPGCKIVKTAPTDTAAAIDPIAAIVTETYSPKLVPEVTAKATDIQALRAAIAAGLDDAGAASGKRGGGEAGSWSFAVKGIGVVVAEDRASRAAKLELDTDADGKADTTLQLGPVIKGTALRDVASFYDFTNFRDQIEFAKLARGLNDAAHAAITLPEGDLTGRAITFSGAFSLRTAADPMLVVPLELTVAP